MSDKKKGNEDGGMEGVSTNVIATLTLHRLYINDFDANWYVKTSQ